SRWRHTRSKRDWSSDVCSSISNLPRLCTCRYPLYLNACASLSFFSSSLRMRADTEGTDRCTISASWLRWARPFFCRGFRIFRSRSEERGGGEEAVCGEV